jgi:hypothetical protein
MIISEEMEMKVESAVLKHLGNCKKLTILVGRTGVKDLRSYYGN